MRAVVGGLSGDDVLEDGKVDVVAYGGGDLNGQGDGDERFGWVVSPVNYRRS